MKKSKLTADFLLFSAVVLIAALAVLAGRLMRSDGASAVVRLNSKEYATLSLFENAELDVDGYLTVVVKNGEVYVLSAKCPDKICEKHGKISKSKEVIACLPYGITVEIIGSEYDAMI